ncbi:MAG: peptidoglycan DD-metalloendopeptidase family protein [Candidatus Latescibacterota bacterium]
MPQKRLTFIFIPSDEGHVREYHFAPQLLYGIAFVLSCLILSSTYFAWGFFRKTDQENALLQLQAVNADLLRNVDIAEREVADFERVMAQLVADDDRLRDYHMMEPLSPDIRLGGVGGSEDLPEEDIAALPEGKREMLRELSTRIMRLKQRARFQEESFAQIERQYLESEGDLRHFPTIWPVPQNRAWISSGFGHRIDPFTGRKARHLGVDFAGRTGTPIYATGDGIVTHAYMDRRLGNILVIEHSAEEVNAQGESYIRQGKFRTEYGHMQKMLVGVGERVKRNQRIGLMGSTGRSTGPHLHYAVRYIDRKRGGVKGYVDPKDFLLDHVQRGAEAQSAQVAGWEEE